MRTRGGGCARRPAGRRARCWAGLLAICLLTPVAASRADTESRVGRWAEALGELSAADGVLARPPAGLSDAEAGAVRARYVATLLPRRGPVVGYKAALTSPAAQQRFGLTAPVYGFLLRDMLLADGARVRRPGGALEPLVEADLVVRVGSAQINDASSPRELLAALDAVLPFIEFPALPYQDQPDAGAFVAANAGAWRGVLGAPIPLQPGTDWARRLPALEVTLATADGTVLGAGSGAALLGDPLRVVVWLRDALHQEGRRLARGDLISLGSLTAPQPVPWGQEVVASYRGLGREEVRVRVRCD